MTVLGQLHFPFAQHGKFHFRFCLFVCLFLLETGNLAVVNWTTAAVAAVLFWQTADVTWVTSQHKSVAE